LKDKLFKGRKGAGIIPPNYRGGSTEGGAISDVLREYFARNASRIAEVEKHLMSLHGRQFWQSLVLFVKKELATIIPRLGQISANVAPRIAQAIINRLIPASFQRFISTQKSGSG